MQNNKLQKIAYRNIIFGNISIWFFLIFCIVLLPQGLRENNGFSYYGINKITLLPYSLAFITYSYFLIKVRESLPDILPYKIVKKIFLAMVIMFFGLILTPYSANHYLEEFHNFFGASLFVIQLILCTWLVFSYKKNFINQFLFSLMIFGGIISFFSLND